MKRTCLSLLAASSLLCLRTAVASQPNIVLIVTDDQRWDSINALAPGGGLQTPHLDSLASSGFVFGGARYHGSRGAAVCVSSRASILTGQHLWRSADNLSGRMTLGQCLTNAGYYAFMTGKWHNQNLMLSNAWTSAQNITSGFLSTGYSVGFTVRDLTNGVLVSRSNVASTHATDLVGATATNFIGSYDRSEPFFLYVALNAPHDPFETPSAWRAPYVDASTNSVLPLPPSYLPEPLFDHGVLTIRDEMLQTRPLDPQRLGIDNATYHGMVRQLDHWVGEIEATLAARGWTTNTLIVFTSDHGLARGDHGLLGKQNLYEHTLRVPFIVKGPGVPAGGRNDSVVYLHDLYPTFADYAGASLPTNQVDGLSLRPLIEGQLAAHRSVAYQAYTENMRSLVANGMKLIEYKPTATAGEWYTQLFDLQADPREQANLATNAAYAATLAGMRTLMLAQRAAHGDAGTFWSNNSLTNAPADPALPLAIAWNNGGLAQPTTGVGNLIAGTVAFALNGGPSSLTVGGRAFVAYNLGMGFVTNLYTDTPASTGDAGFDSLIRSLTYGGGAGAANVAITGLVSGETYRIQFFYNDQRAGASDRVMLVGPTGTAVPGSQTNDFGTYVTGSFAAPGPTGTLTLRPDGFGNSHLSALLVTGLPAALAPTDSDQDAYTDLEEARLGTNPADPASRFRWDPLPAAGPWTELRWFAWPDVAYQPMASTNLLGAWTPLGPPVHGQGRMHSQAVPAAGDRVFLRVAVPD